MTQDPALVQAAKRAGVRDTLVLDAMASVDRSRFVPPAFRSSSQVDQPLPIGQGQVTTQPSLVAKMVEALGLLGGERVLEIGTGHGYQAAVLSRIAGQVVTVDRLEALASAARRNLEAAGIQNVLVITGDGALGYPPHAPYDAIIVAAAALSVPPPLVDQLLDGGTLVQPIGPGGHETVTAFTKRHGVLAATRTVTGAYFVPFVGADEKAPSSHF